MTDNKWVDSDCLDGVATELNDRNDNDPPITDVADDDIEPHICHIEQFLDNLEQMDSMVSQKSKDRIEVLINRVSSMQVSKGEMKNNVIETVKSKDEQLAMYESQGCKPKIRTNTKSEKGHILLETNQVPDADNNDQIDSQQTKVTNQDVTNALLKKLIDTMDGRRAPVLHAFDEKSGENLVEYLTEFEQYCKDNIKGQKHYWIQELESKLSGQLLKAFKTFKDHRDTYENVKDKLVAWFGDMEDIRKEKAKAKFRTMRREENESLYLFSSTIEQQFKLAYPNKDIQESKTLSKKFIDSIPEDFRNEIQIHMRSKCLTQSTITWNEIQKLASLKDIEIQVQSKALRSEKKTKEIVINFQEERYQSRNNNYQRNNNRQMEWRNSQPNRGGMRPAANYHRFQFPSNANFQRPQSTQNFRPQQTRGQYRPNNFFRNNRPPMIRFCTYCQGMSHNIQDCRARLGLCILCGDENHTRQHCPRITRPQNYDHRNRFTENQHQQREPRNQESSQNRDRDTIANNRSGN